MANRKKAEVEVAIKEEKKVIEEAPIDEVVEAQSIDEFLDEGAPIEEPKSKKKEKVEVDTTPVDKSNAVESTVRIKMRENHKCWVGGECYWLQKGQCYNVPKEVKMRLSRAGLLLPL